MTTKVTVIDYGVGNLHSVLKALRHLGFEVIVDTNGSLIGTTERLVLPGVGAFPKGMQGLLDCGQKPRILEHVANGGYLLGICLGAQLLLDESDEFGKTKGLGLIPGKVQKLPEGLKRIPQVGWRPLKRKAACVPGFKNDLWSYFVHSYHMVPSDPQDLEAVCLHEGHEIAAIVGRGRIRGVQFHPEKSAGPGLRLLQELILAPAN